MERLSRGRALLFLGAFFALVLFFGLRLYAIQVVEADTSSSNIKTYTTLTTVKAARGDILDCNGNVLVTNRASYDLVFNHYVILSATGTSEYLLALVERCQELGVEYIDHFPISTELPFTYTLSDYSSSWQNYFQAYLAEIGGGLDSDISAPLLMKKLRDVYDLPEEWTDEQARAVIGIYYELKLRQGSISNLSNYVFMEDVSATDLAAILELNVPGLTTESSTVREYNTEYAAHILGYCSAMTAEQWEYYSQFDNYSMDNLVGQTGLEAAFEEYLHGTDGIRCDTVTADGTLIESYYLDGYEPQAGSNVELTIDLNLQITAEDAMASLFAELQASGGDGSDVQGGAVVVMEVKTGKILACASYPTYNLATFREDYEELSTDSSAPLYNRALMATYPPGSTYKMSMVIAGNAAGYLSSSTEITDLGIFSKYADSGFTANCLQWTNYHSTHGTINAMQALSVSCNYFFYVVGDSSSLSYIDDTAKGLGLGESTGVELSESTGHRANAETKALLYTGDQASWYQADQIVASIGQSDNLFTPLQLCVYVSTLANRGVRYRATFLNQVVSSDYTYLELTNTPEILSTMTISDDAYYMYTTGMRMVATEGTAKSVFANYPIAVACKTGTAQNGYGTDASDNGAFVCYAPYDDPEIAICVYGERAGHGSYMASIAKEILDTYFDDPEVSEVTTIENQLS